MVRRWQVIGLSDEDGEATGWNRVTFEISTGAVILLTFCALFAAGWVWLRVI